MMMPCVNQCFPDLDRVPHWELRLFCCVEAPESRRWWRDTTPTVKATSQVSLSRRVNPGKGGQPRGHPLFILICLHRFVYRYGKVNGGQEWY